MTIPYAFNFHNERESGNPAYALRLLLLSKRAAKFWIPYDKPE